MQINKKTLLFSTVATAVIVTIGAGLWLGSHPAPEPFYGMVQAKSIDIASKVGARVARIAATEGQTVKAGAPVIELEIPELEAKLREVQALQAAAVAQSDLVDEGARPQEIQAAHAQMMRAQAGAALAQKTFNRVASLYKDGLVSRQKYDEASANLKSQKALLKMASEQYDIAKTGARVQQKEMALAKAQQAQGGVDQVASLAKEKIIAAPITGEVSRIFIEPGEVIGAGMALATLVNLEDQWATFNIREDDMPQITMGTVLKAHIPALGEGTHDFKVYFINPRGDYATWRATRQSSGFDLRTFEVRAKPVSAIKNLRPGMSVIVNR